MHPRLSASMAMLVWLTCMAYGQVIHVPADQATIQAGIDAASDGDTVLVAEGTYFENINFLGKPITVASEFLMDGDTAHISRTIIDGSQPVHPDTASVVYFWSQEDTTSVLTGFTITGGTGTLWSGDEIRPLPAYRVGAGILIWDAGARITHNIIEGNQLNHPTVQPPGVTFDSLAWGAGIAAMIGANHNLVVMKNTIEHNAITSGNLGCGAGMVLVSGAFNFIDINGNLVRENTIQTSYGMAVGGGIAYHNTYYEPGNREILIRNNVISRNTANGNPDSHWLNQYAGVGGLFVNGYDRPLNLKIHNNIISENNCNYKGGGIGLELGDMELINNTVVNNHAEKGGNSIWVRYVDFLGYQDPASKVVLINNIMWSENGSSSEIAMDQGNAILASHNVIKGGWEGEGNIDADPLLMAENFELSASSPCIGTGIYSVEVNGTTYHAPGTDLKLSPRPHPIDPWVDMGALESEFTRAHNPTQIHVPAEQPTIQSGINAADAGDTVLVAEGTYFENISFLGKPITVASEFVVDGDTAHISRTILDGSHPVDPDTASVVRMVMGEDTTSVLTGLTITGGSGTYFIYAPYNFPYVLGGGLVMAWSGGKIEHNIFEDNHLTEPKSEMATLGAGIAAFVKDNRTAIFRNNIIRNNSFSGTSAANGAGMGLGGGRILVEGNQIYDNTSHSENEALGGGIAYWRLVEEIIPELTIRNNHIFGNECSVTGGTPEGGGLYLSGDNLPLEMVVYNNLIHHNKAIGGIGGGVTLLGSAPVVYNNTMVNNEAETGRQLHLTSAVDVTFFNNIVWSESDDQGTEIHVVPDDGVQLNAVYNDIRGGWEGNGNLDTDPLLMAETYELAESSPCIGAGTDSVEVGGTWYRAPITDMNGAGRPDPVDQYVDIGAIESPYERADTVSAGSLKPFPELLLYPNPSKDHITLRLNNAGRYEIALLTLSGQVVRSEVFSGNQYQVDLSGLAKGVYLVRVRSELLTATRKIVKW